ncbi:MAG: T9SS type A sorting domain-containing protein [Candidatus Cloacimonas sp.]|nr:T9SS type A sorting domain-containing protein [Candidatus Cloacimonadota bacterium]
MPIKDAKYFVVLLTILTLFATLTVNLSAQFAGGRGTFNDPWEVATAEQLNKVRDYLGFVDMEVDVFNVYYFKQVADIDLGVPPWNEGEGWLPIGDKEHPSCSIYDGNNFMISGLYINRPDTDYVGLFGYVDTSNPYNLHLDDVDIVGRDYVGSFAGMSERTVIPRDYCPISHGISASGTVKGNSNVGGLYGCYMGRTMLNDSFAKVDVVGYSEGEATIGGLVGLIKNGVSTHNVYSYGTVTAAGMGSYVGGLFGKVDNCQLPALYSYSAGKVVGGENTGGLVGGIINSQGKGKYSYWDIEASGQAESAAGEGKTTTEMAYPYGGDLYSEWDFDTVWQDDVWGSANNGYPILGQALKVPYPAVVVSPTGQGKVDPVSVTLSWLPQFNNAHNNMVTEFAVSFGTDNPPTNIVNRKAIALNTSFTVPIELDYDTTYFWQVLPLNKTGIAESCPVWSFATLSLGEKYFAGGNGFETDPWRIETAEQLKNIHHFVNQYKHFELKNDIDFTDSERESEESIWTPIGKNKTTAFNGVFDGKGHAIKGLHIKSNDENVGFFGYLSEANIKDLYLVDAKVEGGIYVGGIAGVSDNNSEISHCIVMGEVTGAESVGGIVGKNSDSEIVASANKASINGNRYVGGLAGRNNSSMIKNCYNVGKVSGSERTGGLVGHNTRGNLAHNYSSGMVNGDAFVGGLAGSYSESGSKDYRNYWDIEVSGQNSSAAGIGKTTTEMTYPYDTDAFVGWDFSKIWIADFDHTKNNGYPYLLVERDFSTDANLMITPSTIVLNNYPNPFNPETTISFNLPMASEVGLSIYNIKGQLIEKVVNSSMEAGQHKVVWNGNDVSSGLYFYKLTTPEGSLINKMMLLK